MYFGARCFLEGNVNYHGDSSVDYSTGEVLRAAERPPEADVPAVVGNPGKEGQAQRLYDMLGSALERNTVANEKLALAQAEIERLVAKVQTLEQSISAKRAHFHNQLAKAQGLFQTIEAKHTASFTAKGGREISYGYAKLGELIDGVRPALSELGIAHRQPVVDHPTDRSLLVIKTIFSCDGYEEIVSSLSFVSPAKSGGDYKELGTAISYLRRYSLAASLGLAADRKPDVEATDQRSGSGGGYSANRSSNGSRQNKSAPQGNRGRQEPSALPQQQRPQPEQRRTTLEPAQSASSHASQGAGQGDSQGQGVADIAQQLRSLPFGECVQVFNRLDAEEKRQHKPLFDERRAQHQSQTRSRNAA